MITRLLFFTLICVTFLGLEAQEISEKNSKQFGKKVASSIKGDSLVYSNPVRNFSQEDLELLHKNYPEISFIQLYRVDKKIDWNTLGKFSKLKTLILGGPGSMQSADLDIGTLNHLEELYLMGDIHVNMRAPQLKKFGVGLFRKPLDLSFLEHSQMLTEIELGVKKVKTISSENALRNISKIKRLSITTEEVLNSFPNTADFDFSFPHLEYLKITNYLASEPSLPYEKFGKIDSLMFRWGFRDTLSFPSFENLNLTYLELKPILANSGYSHKFRIPKSLETLVFDYSAFPPNIHLRSAISLLSMLTVTSMENPEEYEIRKIEARIQPLPVGLGALGTLSTFSFEAQWEKPKEDPRWENLELVITEK